MWNFFKEGAAGIELATLVLLAPCSNQLSLPATPGVEFLSTYFKSLIVGKIKPLLQRREAKIRSGEAALGISAFCCVFGIHRSIGPLLSLGRNQT